MLWAPRTGVAHSIIQSDKSFPRVSGGPQGTSRGAADRRSVRSCSGRFLHFGDMRLDRGSQCVSAKGRLANAVAGTELPVELRPKSAGRIVDATSPSMNCGQPAVAGGNVIPAFPTNQAQGQCGQRHHTFRKEPHRAGAGGSRSAVGCRIMVRVLN